MDNNFTPGDGRPVPEPQVGPAGGSGVSDSAHVHEWVRSKKDDTVRRCRADGCPDPVQRRVETLADQFAAFPRVEGGIAMQPSFFEDESSGSFRISMPVDSPIQNYIEAGVKAMAAREDAAMEAFVVDVFRGLGEMIGQSNREHGFREETDKLQSQMRSTDPAQQPRAHTALVESVRRLQGNAMMLIVGEVAEAHEELRKGKAADEAYYVDNVGGQHVLSTDPKIRIGRGRGHDKPEGVPSEMADIVIRVMDFCEAWGIDLGDAVLEKMAYNRTRPFKHGKQF